MVPQDGQSGFSTSINLSHMYLAHVAVCDQLARYPMSSCEVLDLRSYDILGRIQRHNTTAVLLELHARSTNTVNVWHTHDCWPSQSETSLPWYRLDTDVAQHPSRRETFKPGDDLIYSCESN